jgi:hypothetical protein
MVDLLLYASNPSIFWQVIISIALGMGIIIVADKWIEDIDEDKQLQTDIDNINNLEDGDKTNNNVGSSS